MAWSSSRRLSSSIVWRTSSHRRGSTGTATTGCLRRITSSGPPSRRSLSGTVASCAMPRPVGMRSADMRTRGHHEAARPPDSERLRADTRKTPLQGDRGRSGEPLYGPGQPQDARATRSRAAHPSGNAGGSAIDRAILQLLGVACAGTCLCAEERNDANEGIPHGLGHGYWVIRNIIMNPIQPLGDGPDAFVA